MAINVERGSDVTELVYKPKHLDVLWHSPAGDRPLPSHGGPVAASGPEFEDYYCGGWQDLLPSIGPPAELHGAKFGQHGETGLLSWGARVEEDSDSVKAVLKVAGLRYPYSVKKTITMVEGSSTVKVVEKLKNTSNQRLEYYWLHHPAFGEPFLEPGCKLELPPGSRGTNIRRFGMCGRVADCDFDWPRATGELGDTVDLSIIPKKNVVAEETTFVRMKEGWYHLKNPRLGVGVHLRWDTSIFRWIWFWQNYGAPDYPYFGSGWNIAIEPATSLPTILGRRAAKDAIVLDGGKSITTQLEVSLGLLPVK